MDWQQISFEVQESEVDLISEVLAGLGSLSITFKDAQGNDIYEPPVGTTPLWEKVTVTALFPSEMSKESLAKTILEICHINISNTFSLKDKVCFPITLLRVKSMVQSICKGGSFFVSG